MRVQRSGQDSWALPTGEPLAGASEERRSVQARAESLLGAPASGSGQVVHASPKLHFSRKWGYYRFNESMAQAFPPPNRPKRGMTLVVAARVVVAAVQCTGQAPGCRAGWLSVQCVS